MRFDELPEDPGGGVLGHGTKLRKGRRAVPRCLVTLRVRSTAALLATLTTCAPAVRTALRRAPVDTTALAESPPAAPAQTPTLQLAIVDEVRGEGLPCKLLVAGRNGTATPRWGPDEQRGEWLDEPHGALGIGRWILLARGRLELPVGPRGLPPGTYALTVTRGPEYAPVELGEVQLSTTRGAALRGTLRRAAHTEGWIAGEFHIHSAPSVDSDVPLEQRVLSLAAEGVEVFASTDHDTSEDFAPALAAMGLTRQLHWMRGDEASTDAWGHLGLYPLPLSVMPERDLRTAPMTVEQVAQRARALAPGVIVQLNHPLWRAHPIGYWDRAHFDPTTGRSEVPLFAGFDAVELFNAHTLDEPGNFARLDEVLTTWFATLSLGHRATGMGNTDTHRLSHGPPGWPRTWLRVPEDDPARVTHAQVTAALLAHQAVAGTGPFLDAHLDGRPPGSTVPVRGPVMLTINLTAPAFLPVDSVELWQDRALLRTFPVEPASGPTRQQRWEVPITAQRDGWLVLRTRAAAPLPTDVAGDYPQPMPAATICNPFYLDVGGDGWTAPGIPPSPSPAR